MKKFLRGIGIAVCTMELLAGVVFFVNPTIAGMDHMDRPIIALIAIMMLFFLFLLLRKKQPPKEPPIRTDGVLHEVSVYHISGLPMSQDSLCKIQHYPDCIRFIQEMIDVKLPLNKIKDLGMKSETEIQEQYIANPGGAIAGAMLFGPLGALIGGKEKKKTKRTSSTYFSIMYQKDQESEFAHLVFRVGWSQNLIAEMIEDIRSKLPKTIVNL